ncbi:hypothetical protein ACT8ZS_06815 [Paenibacillus sp. M.A.Huq-84]
MTVAPGSTSFTVTSSLSGSAVTLFGSIGLLVSWPLVTVLPVFVLSFLPGSVFVNWITSPSFNPGTVITTGPLPGPGFVPVPITLPSLS